VHFYNKIIIILGASDLGFCALTPSEHIDDQLEIANQILDQPDTQDFNLDHLMKKCQHVTGFKLKRKLNKIFLNFFILIYSWFRHICRTFYTKLGGFRRYFRVSTPTWGLYWLLCTVYWCLEVYFILYGHLLYVFYNLL